MRIAAVKSSCKWNNFSKQFYLLHTTAPPQKKKKIVLSPALSYPRYIMQNRKCTQKMDKTIIYFMIGSEADTIINKRADMIMHKCINTNSYGKFCLLIRNMAYLVCFVIWNH